MKARASAPAPAARSNSAAPARNFARKLELPARLLLGGVLLYAGFSKLNDGWRFAEAIANYRLLPAQANQILALTLPWLEVALGLLLILGLWLRAAAGLSALLFFAFAAAVAAALARNLDISCGCFGTGGASQVGIKTLALDLFCFACAIVILLSRPLDE
jgi:uncharacterized membrane protein YphA (DoxX/SURF4 family)